MHRNDAIKCEARDEMKAEAFNYSIECAREGNRRGRRVKLTISPRSAGQ